MGQILAKFIPNGLDVTKLADGSVSNTEFQYINSLTSNAQDQLDDKIESTEKGAANGVATLDANSLIPVTQIPPAAIERLVIVADQAARFALTTATVQNGDTVKQTDTNEMFFVKDDTNLNNAAGYEVYSAGTAVNFSGSLAGEVTGTQGATVVGNAAVIGKVLTGYVSGAGVVAATDTILQAIQKLNGNVAAITPGTNKGRETITLTVGDIANGYVDLAEEVIANSVILLVKGGGDQLEGEDYDVLLNPGNPSRIDWNGQGLDGLLASGDVIQVQYDYL